MKSQSTVRVRYKLYEISFLIHNFLNSDCAWPMIHVYSVDLKPRSKTRIVRHIRKMCNSPKVRILELFVEVYRMRACVAVCCYGGQFWRDKIVFTGS